MEPQGSLPCTQGPATVPYPESDESSPHPPIIFHLNLGLSSGLFLQGFSTKELYAFLISPMCATGPTHLILLNLITQITFGEAYKL
jgi:hypothetical protein